MSAKLAAAVAVMLASSVGCFAPASDGDEPVADETATAASTGDALSIDDGRPSPLDHPVPVILVPEIRPIHDLDYYIAQLKRPTFEEAGGCVVHLKRIWDPARGREITVPITVCN